MKILRLRIALYIIAFVATFAITYLLKTDGATDKTDTRTMSEAGLPVVYMVSEESERSVPDVGRSGGYFRRTAAGIIDTGDGAAGFSGIVEVQRAAL